jgi:hypothetical protein
VNSTTSHTTNQSEARSPDKKLPWFGRLKKKWKVTGTQLVLILCVFAITGTTTAYITRMITSWMDLQSNEVLYWVMKLVILIFGYQILILLFSIPFGQFRFFWNYEKKLLNWFRFRKASKVAAKNTAA